MATLPKIEDFDDPDYDPFVAEEGIFGEIEDLHGKIEELRREHGDVIPSSFMELMGVAPPTDDPRFTFLAYDDVANILTDYKAYSNFIFTKTLGLTFGRTLSAMDPPEHHRFRRIFQKAFLPQNIARWGDKIVDPVVNELIAKFIHRGEADLIQEFTKLYPFEIIYRQLGLPAGDGPVFHRLAVAENFVYTNEGREAARKLGTYFKSLLDERRENPGDDLASALINAEEDGEKLPEDVIISFLRQLINAAGDTTFRGTSVLLTGLLTNPDQFDALRKDRGLMSQAIEEGLRWEPPVAYTERTAIHDCVISGVHIPAGATLNPSLAAANIDKRVFENGEKFDIFRRKTKPPVIFAFGPHMCVGQHLAKLEIIRALTALMDRLPNLRLDPDMPAPVIQGAMLRHPKHLYVRFD
jgi:cytochrome P450